MARVEPFAGITYDTDRVDLDDVVAPPYDVVSESQRVELAARSPYNSIQVELPVPDESQGLDRYENAAHLFDSWLDEGVLRTEQSPAVYVYRMSFVDEAGRARSTTGVVAALGLDPSGQGDVLPHEQTMPKPKGDRLDLLRATRANLSPVWGLSGGAGLGKLCAAATEGIEGLRAASEGVVHELWPVTGEAFVSEICDLAGDGPMLLADGHHRYETACAYLAEREPSGGSADGARSERKLVMAYIVELAEDELLIRPINRLVSALPDDFDLPAALRPFFEVLGGPDDVDALAAAGLELGGIGMMTRSGSFVLRPTAETEELAGAPLDSSRLGVGLAALPEHHLVYQHGRSEPVAALESGEAQAAFFLRPATVDQISEIARGGTRMPPKTTFFEPKPRTGMVFRRVP